MHMWLESGFYNRIFKIFDDDHSQTHPCLKGYYVTEEIEVRSALRHMIDVKLQFIFSLSVYNE